MERTTTFAGDPNVGVFARVLGDIVIVPPEAPAEFRDAVRTALDAEIVETTVQGSAIIGSLLTGNRKGIVVSGIAGKDEIAILKEYREIMLLSGSMNAAGNVILANDHVAFVHPEMEKDVAGEIGSFLGVKVMATAFGGVRTVGMAGAATEKGIIVHPRTTDADVARIAEFAGVPVGTGTINMGSGLIGTGLLVNSRGYIAGAQTSGFELGRIEDVFGFLE
ncbi:MAG TPA: translation initiation factor IF-6 [Methanoregulaceae archaeon]|nr:translation initiation factor IF-6 [Methanoregulaceae archaeon]HPD74569.1 translation initiation factor IF-6 [Methanoregulaceae archaeon]HRY74841.1 translation initiation factor IF-6 [Methanoregulaceae archaeon]